MMPGPPLYYNCDSCKKIFFIQSIISFGNYKPEIYTDGYMDAVMFFDEPNFKKCPYCNTPFWIQEKQILIQGKDYANIIFDKALESRFFQVSDMLLALDNNFARSNEQKKYLYTYIWWHINHRRRDLKFGPEYLDNLFDVPYGKLFLSRVLVYLYELLDINDSYDRILKAEIARELGDFEQCKTLLKFSYNDNLYNHVKTIENYCLKEDIYVHKIKDLKLDMDKKGNNSNMQIYKDFRI